MSTTAFINPCELANPFTATLLGRTCGWDGKTYGCTTPGCFGPAIFELDGLIPPRPRPDRK